MFRFLFVSWSVAINIFLRFDLADRKDILRERNYFV